YYINTLRNRERKSKEPSHSNAKKIGCTSMTTSIFSSKYTHSVVSILLGIFVITLPSSSNWTRISPSVFPRICTEIFVILSNLKYLNYHLLMLPNSDKVK